MKKCKFCSHSGYTERGEQVCAKYLLYVGEDKFEKTCSGFELNLNNKHLIIVTAAILLTMALILFCL